MFIFSSDEIFLRLNCVFLGAFGSYNGMGFGIMNEIRVGGMSLELDT